MYKKDKDFFFFFASKSCFHTFTRASPHLAEPWSTSVHVWKRLRWLMPSNLGCRRVSGQISVLLRRGISHNRFCFVFLRHVCVLVYAANVFLLWRLIVINWRFQVGRKGKICQNGVGLFPSKPKLGSAASRSGCENQKANTNLKV